jgi:glycosyltransferase involved in cell wall biosynthesis
MTSAIAADPAALRVLFLTHAFPRWTGDAAGSFILRFARALRQLGIEVSVLAPHAANLPTRDSVDGIEVVRFRYAPPSLETLAYTGTMAEQVRDSWSARFALGSLFGAGFWRLLREQRRIAPRLVHAHWWFPAGVVAAAASRLSGVPFVTSMHGSDVRLARSTAGAATALQWVMRASRATTTVSRWLSDEAHAMTPELPAPRVLPMPAATELFTPGGTRAHDRLLFVGRLNAQKGIELLLRAIGVMRTPTRLDVVGDGPDADAMRTLAASLGIAERVTWHGALPQPALPQLYRSASALIVPSRDEGLGLVAVEAQLCETPVIAFDSGGLRDIVEHGVTGILVDVFTADALARAADELLASPDRAASLGVAGRRAALAVFSPDAVARSYDAIYRSALGSSRSK